MKVHRNISLKPYNTFGIDVQARELIEVFTLDELTQVVEKYSEVFPLGGGSNLLLTKDVEIPIVKLNLKGIEVVKQTDDLVWITAHAGENWHQFVNYCLEKDYGGIENLALIPGNVGTTPVQNIGAYGVEIKDVLVWCEAMEISTQKMRTFTNQECEFAYRESIFKTSEKGKYIITSVTFCLTKRNHILQKSYGAIDSCLMNLGIEKPTIQDIAKAVVAIRQSKLPDPKKLGNSGSFFKNPIIQKSLFERIKKENETIPHYIVSDTEVKIPAAWLIESCGFKGYQKADAGVHKNQPLVLVNYGKATGKDIYNLAKFIQKTIKDRYDIDLEMEVNVIE